MKNKDFYGSKNWRSELSNIAQIGGIETSVLDNGNGRGVRIAWFNTGAGLRFKVVLDRAMDIADAFFREYCLCWISDIGVCAPATSTLGGFDWLSRFGGGLLVSCGMTHVGGPDANSGLHDRLSNLPAQIVSIVQPHPREGKFDMSISGIIRQSTVFGPHLELRRTISARLGENKIAVRDEVVNIGNESVPHMMLYHCNLGWPLIDEGTKIVWSGKWSTPNDKDKIINSKSDFTLCRKPTPLHSGAKESVAFIDIDEDKNGICRCVAKNKSLGFGLEISFPKKQLPWLINWQHWGENEYVTALEPATNPPIGRENAQKNGTLKHIAPFQSEIYNVDFGICQ